jgi:hypothetical protein
VASGTLGSNHEWTSAVFGAMGFAYAAEASGRKTDPELFKAVDYLLTFQKPDGGMPVEFSDPPVVQGAFMMTSNSLVAFRWAAAHSRDAKYREAADHALAWIANTEPVTTQDRVFKIVAVNRYGTLEQKRAAWPLLEEFAADTRLRLPMLAGNRSLNLSNAVAVVVFEAWRQIGFLGAGA